MACPRKKATMSYIKEISLLPSVRSILRTNIHLEEGEFRPSLPILESHSMRRRVFNKRDNFVPASQYSGTPTGFLPSRCIPEYEEYQPIKRTIEPANTIVVRALAIPAYS